METDLFTARTPLAAASAHESGRGHWRTSASSVESSQWHTNLKFFTFVAFLLSALSGCALTGSRNRWTPPSVTPESGLFVASSAERAAAEAQYSAGLAADAAGSPTAIDHYFAVAAATWPYHFAGAAAPSERGNELYRSSVELMIAAASRHCRLNPTCGILLTSGQVIPITYHGFVWSPADFRAFLPVGRYATPHLSTRYVTGGIGVPYVILTDNSLRRPFLRCGQPFAATAVLAPSSSIFTTPIAGTFALELYDPLRVSTTDTGQPLARDLTAPIAYAASLEGDTWLVDFLRPGVNVAEEGLHMHEPFQPGKIPVVFVHGLASDPRTWSQLENDLRATPAIFERYQFWFFRYDTGKPFLSSAALLRRHLAEIRQTYDPMRCDPNLSNTVLIGHSMGGLLSKLQVTASGDQLWQAAATRPLNTITTDPTTRADLANAFYFYPSPDVTRVIFIATPHRGSIAAQRCVGRLSSALVTDPPQMRARHAQLVRDNPGVFRDELSRSIPTSVDLLEPDSQILEATTRLCYRPDIQLHSVIGDYEWTPSEGQTDGVVAVSSARLVGVQTELFVDAEHTRIQSRPETSREVSCILLKHATMNTNSLGNWEGMPASFDGPVCLALSSFQLPPRSGEGWGGAPSGSSVTPSPSKQSPPTPRL